MQMTAKEPQPQRTDHADEVERARQQMADSLLASTASMRRSGRRYGRRPTELATLSGAQLELVRLVRRRPGVSVADAAADLRLAANTVSTLVRQLTAAGLLVRNVDERDRRVARLELTAEMADKVGAWRDRRMTALASAMGRLTPHDQQRLAAALPVLAQLAEQLHEEDFSQ
jgi:DNA-binding MarR family transcriptional regulator